MARLTDADLKKLKAKTTTLDHGVTTKTAIVKVEAALPDGAIRFVLPGPPVPKPRMTQRDRWKQRPCVTAFWEFRDKMRALVGTQTNVVRHVEMTFYLPFPASYRSSKRDAMSGAEHWEKSDLDNLIKAVLDSVLAEDKQVCWLRARKYWEDAEGPRTELIIYPNHALDWIRR